MKLQALKCPNCDGILNMDVEKKDFIFCPYCGQKFMLDDEKKEYTINKNININKNVTHTNQTYNEADVIREKTALTKEKMSWVFIIGGFIFIFLIIGGVSLFGNLGVKQEEKRLQELVNEIMIDIENEDYDTAEIKAKQLYWNNSWTSEPVEKWDETRETIIDKINKAQGIDTSVEEEEESKGFFDWFN